jgi:hypothetical protein
MNFIYEEILKNIGYSSRPMIGIFYAILFIGIGLIFVIADINSKSDIYTFGGFFMVLIFGGIGFNYFRSNIRGIFRNPVNKTQVISLYRELKNEEGWTDTEDLKIIAKFSEDKMKSINDKVYKTKIDIQNNIPSGLNLKDSDIENFAKIYVANKEHIKLIGKSDVDVSYDISENICKNVLKLETGCMENLNIKKDFTPIEN